MFSLCMVESEADEVNLHGVTSLGLKQALDFAYTGQVLYSSSNWEREVKTICNNNRSPLKNYYKWLLFTLPSTRSFGLTDLILDILLYLCVCMVVWGWLGWWLVVPLSPRKRDYLINILFMCIVSRQWTIQDSYAPFMVVWLFIKINISWSIC